ncbi:DUF58 domain-containing protein [Marinisporobacter balticus]|uniref:Uncharacterized protein (DUF58 family) n=1 Tax=Marinisporobacter balticus TaxID=2018667 RepID=A0A4R2KPB5_9FIRM|nr:DUF58 domain-containing protein [Marinisporobacter balticus]TCO74592.1 uncharacterized protein (DUF58 family) [Marinisporobacter balticus]
MTITKKFILFSLLGIVFIGISLPFGIYFESFILYNTVLLLFTILDYFITPIKDSFEVERMGDHKLSLFEEESISIRIYNKSKLPAVIEVLHEFPGTFICKNNSQLERINPYSSCLFTFMITSNKRGAFLFDEIYIRRKGRLGLVKKDLLIKNSQEYKVYPSLKNLKKYHIMLKKDYFIHSGNKVIKRKSDGREFESLREYVRGDDIRKINWVKTARENKLMVNQYEPENNKHIYILLDTGRTMSYRVNAYSKLDLAINASVFLSDVVCYNKDQSGLMVFNTKVDAFVKPSKGNHHRNTILEALYHVEGTRLTSNYDEVLFYLNSKEKRRSLICIFTDMDTLQEVYYIEKGLEYITQKHEVILFLVKDEKLDKAIQIKINNQKDAFVKGMGYKMKNERKKIIKTIHRKGVTCIECDKEDIIYQAVNGYMRIKNKDAI